jgi:hypothetical protein
MMRPVLSLAFRLRWAAVVSAGLGLLLFFTSGTVAAQGVRGVAVDPAVSAGIQRVYLPLVFHDDPMRTQRLCRFGIGAPSDIARYPVNQLRIGWYTDWGATPQPVRPGGIEYLQMIRLHQVGRDAYSSTPQGNDLLAIVGANPGALWVIGNEPDRRKVQDDLVPAVYALAYHDLYHQIKAADPTARIVAGSIVQPTPLRLQYLDMVLDSYRARYGQAMPVDVWNIHAFILNEVSCTYDPGNCWGADVPPGIDAPYGMRYDVQDNDSLVIFKQFIVDFRQWMADRGYKERPLIITEYGVLMPEEYGFPPTRVNAYMNATFDYLSTAAGSTGYSADKGRLVQAWAWYSLSDRNFNGWLYNPQTGARSAYGDNFAAYTARITPVVNLQPIRVWAEPAPLSTLDGPVTLNLVAEIANSGNISTGQPVTVRFYKGNPRQGGALIGATQLSAPLNGCGAAKTSRLLWQSVGPGVADVWVEVDPDNVVPESDEQDNLTSATIVIPGAVLNPPLISRQVP